jgi:hypothetical protein
MDIPHVWYGIVRIVTRVAAVCYEHKYSYNIDINNIIIN